MNAPTREDSIADGASQLIGGRWGRHARRHGWWWTPLEVALAVTILVLIGGYLQKAPCTKPAGFTNEYQYTRLCYTDTYVLYTAEGLNAGPNGSTLSVPYRDHPVEYPPVIGGLMWSAAEITHLVRGHDQADTDGAHATTFFNVTALGLAACALIIVFAMARVVGRRREWDVLMIAASPVLFMDAFTNWDLAAVALTALGLWMWSRGSPAWAGVFLGVGIATKLYPALVLLALLMLCARERQWRAIATATAGAAAGMVAMYVPAIVLSHQTSPGLLHSAFEFPDQSCATRYPLRGWRWFVSLSQTRGADWGSIWLVVQHAAQGIAPHFTGSSGFDQTVHRALGKTNNALSGVGVQCGAAPTALNAISGVAIGLVVAAVAALVALARRRPRVGQVAFLLVAGFIMLNKVDSPQYALWLLPLAVMARPRWGGLLLWQASEVVLGAANLYTLVAQDHSDQGLPLGTYLVFVVIRDVILVWLMVMVVREVVDPRRDLVRRDGVDDPAGGLLADPESEPEPDVIDGRLAGAPA